MVAKRIWEGEISSEGAGQEMASQGQDSTSHGSGGGEQGSSNSSLRLTQAEEGSGELGGFLPSSDSASVGGRLFCRHFTRLSGVGINLPRGSKHSRGNTGSLQ